MKNFQSMFRITALTICSAGALASGSAFADDPAAYEGNIITLQEAIQIAEDHTGGTVTSSEFDNDDDDHAGVPVYEIDLAKDGVEHEVKINANDGSILEDEIDD